MRLLRRFAHPVDVLGAIGFGLLVSWRFLRPSQLVAGFDTLVYTTPNQAVTWTALRHLHLPQWNPFLFGGAPHLANPQVGAFYPVKYLFLWLPPHRAVLVLTSLHVVWLALGMVALLTHGPRLRTPAPLVGAIVAAGSGAAVAQLVHFEQILTISWAPWLLLWIDRALVGRLKPRLAVPAIAVTVGSMLLVGHTQPAYYVMCFAGVWTVGRALDTGRWRQLPTIALGVAGGAALAAVQLVPTLHLVDRSVRSGGLPLSDLEFPPYLVNWRDLLVSLLGDPFSLMPKFFGEAYGAVGVAAVVLAAIGVSVVLRRGVSYRWTIAATAAVAVVAALFAMGPATPVFTVAFRVMPGFDLFRVPGRWLVVTDLGFAIAAAFGCHRVLDRESGALDRTSWAAVGACGAVVAIVVLFVHVNLPEPRSVAAWAAVGVCCVLAVRAVGAGRAGAGLAAVALVCLPVAELGSVALKAGYHGPSLRARDRHVSNLPLARFLRGQDGRTLAIGRDDFSDPLYLARTMRPNVNATAGVRSIDGYDGGPWVTRRWTQTMELLTARPFDPGLRVAAQIGHVDPDAAARLGVRWLVVDRSFGEGPRSGWSGPVLSDGDVDVWENPAYSGEAFLYRRALARPADDAAETLAGLGSEAHDTTIVEGADVACEQSCDRTGLELRRLTPERLSVDVDAGSQGGLVVVAEGWDDGWRATVDGRRVRVMPADGGLIGVAVGEGRHRITLAYETPGLRAGAAVTAVAATAVAVLVLTGLLARRRSTREHASDEDASEIAGAPSDRRDTLGGDRPLRNLGA